MSTFGQRLKHLRVTAGTSQKEMATLLEITPNAYQKYEYDTREPNFQMLIAIADHFQVPTDYLIGHGIFEHWDTLLEHKDTLFSELIATFAFNYETISKLPENKLMYLLFGLVNHFEISANNELLIYYRI